MESANIIICCDQVWLSSKKGRKENVWCEAKVFCQTCCLLGGLWAVIRDSLVLLWTEISKDLGQRSSGAIGCTCDVAISQLGVCVRGVVVLHCSQHHQLAFCVSCLSENLHWVCLRYFGQFPQILSPPFIQWLPTSPSSFWLQSFSPSIILIVSVGGRVFYSHPLLFRHRGTNFIWPFFCDLRCVLLVYPTCEPCPSRFFFFGENVTQTIGFQQNTDVLRSPFKQRSKNETSYG